MKKWFCLSLGVMGSSISTYFGGWDSALTTLTTFMVIDWLTGLLVSGVFHNSPKTESGTLKSSVGFRGLVKKCVMFLFVLIAYRLDLMVNTSYIKDLTIIGFCANELLSIIENAGLMGITPPAVISQAIDLLQKGDKK